MGLYRLSETGTEPAGTTKTFPTALGLSTPIATLQLGALWDALDDA